MSRLDQIKRCELPALGQPFDLSHPLLGHRQGALHHLGLPDGNLPIPILHGAGEIEILAFLGHLDLRLRACQFRLLKLGVLFVDQETSYHLERPGKDELLLRIEELEVRNNRREVLIDAIPHAVANSTLKAEAPGMPDLELGVVITSIIPIWDKLRRRCEIPEVIPFILGDVLEDGLPS